MSKAKALEYLTEAETVILSYMANLENVPEDAEDSQIPSLNIMVQAVLRLISRAAGVIEATEEVR